MREVRGAICGSAVRTPILVKVYVEREVGDDEGGRFPRARIGGELENWVFAPHGNTVP